MCSTHIRPALNTAVAVAEKGGWTATEKREEEEGRSGGGGVGTAGTTSGD